MLASSATANATPPFAVAPNEMAPLVKLNQMLQTQPPSPSRDFMIEKLTYLIDPSDGGVGVYARHAGLLDAQYDTDNALASGTTEGLMDGSNDSFTSYGLPQQQTIKSLVTTTMGQIDYDKLGTSYFNGLVYTNGYFYSDNEVNILGGLVAVDDGSQSPGFPDPSNPGLQVDPGDVYLNRGVRVTYVRDMMAQAGATIGTLGVKVWMSR